MDSLLQCAPVFFAESLASANALLETNPRELKALLTRCSNSVEVPQGVGSALEYIIAGARKLKADEQTVLASLTRCTACSPALAGALARVAAGGGGRSGGVDGSSGGVPKLLGLDWAVSVPVASASAPPGTLPGAPGVTLQLRLELPDGTTTTRAVHVTVAQLALMEASLKEMALSLDRA